MATNRKGGRTAEVMKRGDARLASDLCNADFSRCMHGVRDDGDCGDCNANGCSGGADCDCGSARSRREPSTEDILTHYLH